MAELIALGTTDLYSAEFTLGGEVAVLLLKSASDPNLPACEAQVLQKTSDGLFLVVALMRQSAPRAFLQGPGTFKVLRRACVTAFGVDLTQAVLRANDVVAVVASDGLTITPDSYAQVLAYDGSNNLASITVVADNGNTYVQTFTRTGSNLTGISKWVKQ